VSEFEKPERLEREPTVADVRQLMGASTPHFALHLRNRIHQLVAGLPADHPARVEGEREIRRLGRIAFEGEHRGPDIEDLRDMPAIAQRPGDAGPRS
jgi:hypothetical protein